MKIRRVTTGHDGNGRAIFASDEEIESTGLGQTVLWGADRTVTFPDDGSLPEWSGIFPPLEGFRFSIVRIPAGSDPKAHPESQPRPTPEQQAAREAALGPGRAHMEGAGMHWTKTVDCEIVLSGELILELDDGRETVVRAGDAIVQNGTRHRWRNVGDQDAVFVAFLVGAHHNSPG